MVLRVPATSEAEWYFLIKGVGWRWQGREVIFTRWVAVWRGTPQSHVSSDHGDFSAPLLRLHFKSENFFLCLVYCWYFLADWRGMTFWQFTVAVSTVQTKGADENWNPLLCKWRLSNTESSSQSPSLRPVLLNDNNFHDCRLQSDQKYALAVAFIYCWYLTPN